MSYKWGNGQTLSNREKFLSQLNLDVSRVSWMQVLFRDQIEEIDEANAGRGATDRESMIGADAFITNTPGVGLGLYVADCLPVIIYDPRHHALALAHCGWQSTNLELAAKTVAQMGTVFGSSPSDLMVGIGPGIKKESYVFESPITQEDLPGWQPYLERLEHHRVAIDLAGYNRAQLMTAGVPEANIEISPVDTAKDENFFSHYRDLRARRDEGRFAAVVALRS